MKVKIKEGTEEKKSTQCTGTVGTRGIVYNYWLSKNCLKKSKDREEIRQL